MRSILIKSTVFAVLLLAAGTVWGTNFYVSPDGNNNRDGLTPETAWKSIEHGDTTDQTFPGDTVNILPGRYSPGETISLKTNGTADSAIVYQKLGKASVILDGQGGVDVVLSVAGDYTRIYGLEIANAALDGLEAMSFFGVVADCYVHDAWRCGIDVNDQFQLLLRNVVVNNGETGIRVEGFGDETLVHHNTICYNGKFGVEVTSAVYGVRLINNIVCGNGDIGISADLQTRCAFNNVWNNPGNNYGEVSDSAGGISIEPLFVDPSIGRFDLKRTAGEIDAGLVMDYDYNGSAPDMGAFEKYNVYYIATDGSDDHDGRSPNEAWASIGNGDSLMYPGDTAYVLPGVYADSVAISQSGLADDMISYVGVRDSCLVDGTGAFAAVRIDADYIRWSGIDAANASSSLIRLVGDFNVIEYCRLYNSNYYGLNMSGEYNTFFCNTFTDIPEFAVKLSTDYNQFVNNTFYDNQRYCIDALLAENLIISNNIFFTNSPLTPAVVGDGSTSLTHSIFFGYTAPTIGDVVFGEGCVVADPLMIDPADGNFLLSHSSPALDAGIDRGYPFNGMAPDIGAYETGNPDVIEVIGGSAELVADSTHPFEVIAFDSAGYPTKPGFIFWSHTFGTGNINSSGVFTPDQVGSGQIVAYDLTYDRVASSAPMQVVAGTLTDIDISPRKDTLQVDSTAQFTVSGLDINGNVVIEFGNLTWDVLNGIGTISQTGLFTAQYAGHGFVRAASDLGPSCVSDTVTVTSGELDINVTTLSIPPKELIPGTSTGPLLAVDLSNRHPASISLDSIRVNFTGFDPDGTTRSELDSQIESVALYLELDNQYASLTAADSLIAEGTLDNGQVMFHSDGLVIDPNGGSILMTVSANLDIDNAKNANSISFELTESSDIYLGDLIPVKGDFPIQNEFDFTVDGFPAATVGVNPIEAFTLVYGQSDQPVLSLDLPTNGYAEDLLSSMTLTNNSTFEENDDILRVALWGDVTGDGLSVDDVRLGYFDYSSGFWEISGLSYPLTDDPNHVLITVDVISNQFEGGLLDFEVPLKGIEYLSGADGPDDASLSNPHSFIVMPADRITAVSIPSSPASVAPGSPGNTILTFALYNGYGNAKTLSSVRLTNHSITKSTADFADAELGQVSLHFDENYDRQMDNDPVISSGYFTGGTLQLSTAGLTLPPEALCYFFVAVDLPQKMIDSDSLTVAIDHESDFVFEPEGSEGVNINGDMPLTSGAYLVVDGSIQSQYEVLSVTSSSLSPGDTSITLFAFKPAANGDQADTLISLTLNNLGDAGSSDFEELELWLDVNGDNVWQSSDSLVGSFAYSVGSWNVMPYGLEINAGSPALFVLADVAEAASPSVSFQAEIPLNGCQYSSGNDGPLDLPLTGGGEFVISSSGLRLTTLPLATSYSVGQEITVTANVSNLLGATLDDVYCEFVSVSDGSDSIVLGPVSLAPLGSTEFAGLFTASRVGSESWRVRAFSNTPVDSSATVHTDETQIFDIPSDVIVELLNSTPTAVSRGQANVFPLSIRFHQVDSSPTLSSLRLDSLQIGVKDSDGQPLAADAVFSRMVLATDNTNLVVKNSIPTQSTVTLNFVEPVIVPAGQEKLLSLLVDIDSTAAASSFALALLDASAINIVDKNTLTSATFHADVVFPMQTASCRIEDPSQQLAISGASMLNPYVNYSQEGVNGLEMVVRHPGESGTSQIQITSLSLGFVDEALTPIAASELISELRVLRQQMIIGELTDIESGADSLTVDFGAPPTLNPGETESLYLQFDIKPQSIIETFAVRVADSTAFVVRDISSGSVIAAVSDQDLATGNVFPMLSGFAQLRTPAVALEVCLSSSLPEYVVGGAEGVELLQLLATYPVSEDHSPVRVSDILVRVYALSGVPLNPNELFHQIGASIGDATVIYEPFIELQDGATVFHLDDDGVLINPGDTTAIRLYADIESATPVEHFYVNVQNDGALTTADATDTSSNPGITVPLSCASDFPFSSEVSQVYLRAGRPTISATTPPTQLAYPGQTALPLLELTISYNSPSLQGDLLLNRLSGETLQRTASDLLSRQSNDIFESFAVTIDSDTLSIDSALVGDSVMLNMNDGLTIQRNTSHRLTLVCDISSDAPLGNYLVKLPDSAFCDLLDKNLLTAIYPILNGADYPLLSAELSLTHANLENSFTNYPNPFNPENGEEAIIGFVLAEDAHINIDLFTITGDLVAHLATDEFRSEGPHQQDTWNGQNDSGMRVLPGTYFCRLRAAYVSGRTETFKRKITVIW